MVTPPTPRKIIQIAVTARPESDHFHPGECVIALCDDGSLMACVRYFNETWAWHSLPPLPPLAGVGEA